jgi:hypothetical protein
MIKSRQSVSVLRKSTRSYPIGYSMRPWVVLWTVVQEIPWNANSHQGFYSRFNRGTPMKKTILSFAVVGLLISGGAALSQNTEKTQSPAGTTTTRGQTGTTSGQTTQPSQTGERSGTQSGERRDVDRSERSGERRGGSVTVRGGEREGARVRGGGDRSSVNIRIRGDRDGYRHRHRHHRVGVYVGGCRTVIIKKRYHGRTVVKKVRRCR